MLVIFWIYTFIRLRFWNSILAALIITLGYEFIAIFIQKLTADGIESENMMVFIINNFFFIAANIIGLWSSYHIEKLHRSNFLQKQTIIEENTRIKNISAELGNANAAKDKFFSIIAHDLRNPFNSILSFSSLLTNNLQAMSPAAVQKSILQINASAQSAFKLLENLLEWARSQTGHIEYNPTAIQLSSLFSISYELTEVMAKEKDIELVFDNPGNTEIIADNNMILTVLRNLVSNAIKYTDKGGCVRVLSKRLNNEVVISVSDTGVGIHPDDIYKLFNISDKFSTEGTEKETGTGLGLLLCKEFVEKHGGKISVESEIKKGSVFTFNLPSHFPTPKIKNTDCP
jgi:signal transduction histidine kinase